MHSKGLQAYGFAARRKFAEFSMAKKKKKTYKPKEVIYSSKTYEKPAWMKVLRKIAIVVFMVFMGLAIIALTARLLRRLHLIT